MQYKLSFYIGYFITEDLFMHYIKGIIHQKNEHFEFKVIFDMHVNNKVLLTCFSLVVRSYETVVQGINRVVQWRTDFGIYLKDHSFAFAFLGLLSSTLFSQRTLVHLDLLYLYFVAALVCSYSVSSLCLPASQPRRNGAAWEKGQHKFIWGWRQWWWWPQEGCW